MIQQDPNPARAPELEGPRPPASLARAAKVMYAAALVCAVHAVIYVVTVGAQKSVIKAKHPHLSSSSLSTLTTAAVIFEAVVTVLAAVLFVWIARSCLKGRHGARVTGTVLFAIAILLMAYNLGPGAVTTLDEVVMGVVNVLGLAAVVLLWQRSSSAYFAVFKRPQF